jgi:hypothetical protein
MKISRHSYTDDECVKVYLDNGGLDDFIAEELLEDLNGCHAEVSIAQGNEEVVFQAGEYSQPLFKLIFFEILLKACIENLNVCPVEILQVVRYDMLLQGLCDVKRIPLMGCTKCAILLCVSTRDIYLLFCAWEGLHFKDG